MTGYEKESTILSARDYELCLPYYYFLSQIITPFFTKLVWSKWLDIGQVSISFCVYGPRRTYDRQSVAMKNRSCRFVDKELIRKRED